MAFTEEQLLDAVGDALYLNDDAALARAEERLNKFRRERDHAQLREQAIERHEERARKNREEAVTREREEQLRTLLIDAFGLVDEVEQAIDELLGSAERLHDALQKAGRLRTDIAKARNLPAVALDRPTDLVRHRLEFVVSLIVRGRQYTPNPPSWTKSESARGLLSRMYRGYAPESEGEPDADQR